MEIEPTALPEVLLLSPRVIEDGRGFFYESWNARVFTKSVGEDVAFVQDNHSGSRRGVLRGLHYQLPDQPQGKLVRVVAGAVFDVAVDIRRTSPNFGRWAGMELSTDNRAQLWIPPGFAHGFVAISDSAEVVYKVTAYYSAAHDRSIRWNDLDIGIEWPLDIEPVLSDKDARAPFLRDAELFA